MRDNAFIDYASYVNMLFILFRMKTCNVVNVVHLKI